MGWTRKETEEHLQDAVDGRLSTEDQELFRAGLAEHPDLAHSLDSLTELRGTLLEMGLEKAPDALLSRVRSQLSSTTPDIPEEGSWSAWRSMGPIRAVALAAAAVLLCVVLVQEWPTSPAVSPGDGVLGIDLPADQAAPAEEKRSLLVMADEAAQEDDLDLKGALQERERSRKGLRAEASAGRAARSPGPVMRARPARRPAPKAANSSDLALELQWAGDSRVAARDRRNFTRLSLDEVRLQRSAPPQTSAARQSQRGYASTQGLLSQQTPQPLRAVFAVLLSEDDSWSDSVLASRGLASLAKDLDAGRVPAAPAATAADKESAERGHKSQRAKLAKGASRPGPAGLPGPTYVVLGAQAVSQVEKLLAREVPADPRLSPAPLPEAAAAEPARAPAYRLLTLNLKAQRRTQLIAALEGLPGLHVRVVHPEPQHAAAQPQAPGKQAAGRPSGRTLTLMLLDS